MKNFTTAEGGASAWLPVPGVEDEEIYELFQLLSLHGQNKDALAKSKIGAWEYDIIGPWYKYAFKTGMIRRCLSNGACFPRTSGCF